MLVCTDKANKYNYVGITSAFFSVSLLLLPLGTCMVCQTFRYVDPNCTSTVNNAAYTFRVANVYEMTMRRRGRMNRGAEFSTLLECES